MNPYLKKLLETLQRTCNAERQQKIAERYQKALTWQTVDRPPLVFTYPYPESARFQPYPHREIFDDPEKNVV